MMNKAQSVNGFFGYNFWCDLLYLKLYHKLCKNLLENKVRFWRFLHNFVVRFEVRFMSDIFIFLMVTTARQAAPVAKLVAATVTLPPPRCCCLLCRCAANAANAVLLPSCRLLLGGSLWDKCSSFWY